ncbi:MAG: cellulose binding domain-containing protein [Cellvibrio sp.]|uniref:cellulose binding domain-containing protein n=1 Tax=Cellvibrio sp. TaxID=1965322 RepID=UPI002719FC06|nr:cellulose binding domain-containing protein [Cellvibrio sp.]
MSSFNASAVKPRTVGALKRTFYALGVSLAVSTLSTQAYAGCQYVVTNQWNNGFSATLKITNTNAGAINGWNINWQYSGDNRITSSYNTTLTGSNPYTAKNLSWNSTIQPNQTVEFGVQGTKGAAAAEVPVINGAACATQTSSSAASSASQASSSAISSSVVSSSSIAPSSSSNSSSSAANAAAWNLDSSASYLNFVTTKNTHNVEVHNFTRISGAISATGVATLAIDLTSVNTSIALRDERMRDLLFQTANFPTATVTLNLPSGLLTGLAVGNTSEIQITASLDLHGVTSPVATKVSVQRLSATRIIVQNLSPVVVNAPDHALAAGVEALRAAVGIASISTAVPVDFTLIYDAR